MYRELAKFASSHHQYQVKLESKINLYLKSKQTQNFFVFWAKVNVKGLSHINITTGTVTLGKCLDMVFVFILLCHVSTQNS